MSAMILTHAIGQFVELGDPDRETVLWKYVYAGRPKPYFHPVCTPAGCCITLFEPYDHIWHRGLWFAIKYINGENYWEENEACGTQRTLAPPAVSHEPDGAVRLSTRIEWLRPDGRTVVIREDREVTFRRLAEDAYALDYQAVLTAATDLVLDRRPYDRWGGYSGLTIRGNRNWMNTRLLFPDGRAMDRPLGIPARWCDLSGDFDGGRNLKGGIAIFDHPTNPRHPVPWYGASGPGHYFNAAFLFFEPLRLPSGGSLAFRYRVVPHDGLWEPVRLQRAYDEWAYHWKVQG